MSSLARKPAYLLAWLVAGGLAREASGGDPVPQAVESASERRAVRGTALDGRGLDESAELKEVRRFEEEVFPRGLPLIQRSEGPPGAPAAPIVGGRWRGTGDIPTELRTPEVSRGEPAAAAAPESEWLRTLKLPELPIRWDPQVVRYLDYFKGDPKGRAVMAHWLRRLGRYRAMFERVLEREGVPRDLVYLAMVESGLDSGGTSRVGAGGIWQFMPGAARAYGLEVSYWVDGRRDPERATEAAARYLKDLYVRFGSWHLAFAAYNAGYGAVLKSITRYNTNDFWELIRHEAGLPWESSIYVPKILAAAIIGHNRNAFGFAAVESDAPMAYDLVEPPAGTTLATVARAAGARADVVASLNADLVRERTPPDRPPSPVRIPPGSRPAYLEALDRSRTNADKIETVVMRFGETIDDLARARGVTPRELRRLNGVKDSSELRAGVTVVVPITKPAAVAKPAADRDAEIAVALEDEQTIVALPDRVFSYEGRERVFYRTRDGDDLEEIAGALGVGAADLLEWNNLDAGAKLHPRLILQAYVAKDFDPSRIALLDATKVRVVTLGSEDFLEFEAARRGKKRLTVTAVAGDTLVKVGRRYGLTPGDLARINRFSYNTELQPGQQIVVYSPTGEPPRDALASRSSDTRRPARELTASLPQKGVVGKPVAKARAKPVAKATAAIKKPTTKTMSGPSKPRSPDAPAGKK